MIAGVELTNALSATQKRKKKIQINTDTRETRPTAENFPVEHMILGFPPHHHLDVCGGRGRRFRAGAVRRQVLWVGMKKAVYVP